MDAPNRGLRPWHVALAALAVTWGFSFLLIKLANAGFSPLQVAFGRVALGAATLAGIVAARGLGWPRSPRLWGHLAVVALLLNALPFSLFAYGEQRVTSIEAGVANAATPLFTMVVALASGQERPERHRLLGLAAGFGGVLVLLNARDVGARSDLVGLGECLLAPVGYALGFVYVRRFVAGRGAPAVSLAAAQLLCGTAEMALALPFSGRWPAPSPSAVGGLLVLGVLGTGLAYVLQHHVLNHAGATASATVAYLIPIVSTAAGVVVLHEPLAWAAPVAAAVILGGVLLAGERRPAYRTERIRETKTVPSVKKRITLPKATR